MSGTGVLTTEMIVRACLLVTREKGKGERGRLFVYILLLLLHLRWQIVHTI